MVANAPANLTRPVSVVTALEQTKRYHRTPFHGMTPSWLEVNKTTNDGAWTMLNYLLKLCKMSILFKSFVQGTVTALTTTGSNYRYCHRVSFKTCSTWYDTRPGFAFTTSLGYSYMSNQDDNNNNNNINSKNGKDDKLNDNSSNDLAGSSRVSSHNHGSSSSLFPPHAHSLSSSRLKECLHRGLPLTGVVTGQYRDTDHVEQLGLLGYDFLWADCEHSSATPDHILNLILAAERRNMPTLVRIGYGYQNIIG
jgi:hypothetical protein